MNVLQGEKLGLRRVLRYQGDHLVGSVALSCQFGGQSIDWGYGSSPSMRLNCSRWILRSVWGIRQPSTEVLSRFSDGLVIRAEDSFLLTLDQLEQELQIISYQTGRQFLCGHEYNFSHLFPATG